MEYTAVIKQECEWWIGWIEEVPGVESDRFFFFIMVDHYVKSSPRITAS